MSDYDLPSQFLEGSQNEENFDDLDFDLFGNDEAGADFDGEQGLEFVDESTNQQNVASSGTPDVLEQQPQVPSNVDVQPEVSDEEFLEPQDFVPNPQDGITGNEALPGVPAQPGLPDLQHQLEVDEFAQGQLGLAAPQNIDPANGLSNVNQSRGGLMRGHDQAHSQPTELGVADPFSLNLPTNRPANLEQLPTFDFDLLNAEEWQGLANIGADVDIDDILGTQFIQDVGASSNHAEPLTASRQRSPVNTPGVDSGYDTAAVFREATRGLAPATPQANNAVGRPGPSNAQGTSYATTTAARGPSVEDYADVDDRHSDEPDDESEHVVASYEVEYETYEEHDPLIEQDPSRDNWGQTGMRNEQQVWFNPKTKQWQPSAAHHDMRATLIARAQAEYPDDKYLNPDPTDGIEHGETAFFKPHQNRGPDRQQCADELFIWRDYQPKKDENGKPLKRDKPKSSDDKHPGFMYEGDKILLDPRNNPVVNHKFIPLTLAVHTDPGKLQEMALRPGCRQVDLWARMPRYEMKNEKDPNSGLVPLRDKNTRINMPMTRFREKKGTIAGSDREGTDVIMAGLRRFYLQNGFDPVAAGNSVKAFHRDLEGWEVKEVRLGNTAQFVGRAGRRAVDEETRAARLEKTKKAIENGKKRQAAKNGDDARKRSRDDDEADFWDPQATDTPKRRRGGQEVDAGNAAFDAGYDTHQAYPANGFQGFPHHQQGGYVRAVGPRQVQYSAYGPQYPTNFNQNPPRVGGYPAPAPNRTQQVPHGGVHMQATASPYVNAQALAPLDNGLLNSEYYPEDLYPRFNTGAQSFGPRAPQQTSHLSMAQNPRVSAEGQRHRHVENPSSVPASAGNTLAPGGRGLQRAPQQVLGKRRQRDVPEYGAEDEGTTNSGWRVPAVPNGSHGPMDPSSRNPNRREHLNGQATADGDFNSGHKRRRGNEDLGTEPRPQRQRHPERTPRPSHYGAGGAPTPLLPLDEGFGGVQPGSNALGNAEGHLTSPATIARRYEEIIQGSRSTPTSNRNVTHGMGGAPARQSENLQSNPRIRRPQQVLGKHRRSEEMGQWGEEMYVPHQNLGQQDLGDDFGDMGQDISVPEPKRPRMSATEGLHAPPVQTPSVRPVRKFRMREQEGHLAPTQLYTNPQVRQAPQGDATVQIPPQNIYTNNTPTQLIHPVAPNPSQISTQPQTSQQIPADIRDVRPASDDESQSLDSALRYTRDAFREWTSQEAPVTNLEDSYNTQYREIRSAFRAWWRSDENPYHGDPLPELWRALRWSGGMDDWDAPEAGEHLREARRMGKRAA